MVLAQVLHKPVNKCVLLGGTISVSKKTCAVTSNAQQPCQLLAMPLSLGGKAEMAQSHTFDVRCVINLLQG